MREIVLDTETTGLDPEAGHRVVEIGCIELFNHLQTGRHFRAYLNPERDMPEEAFRVHGLSAEFLADKPRFAAVAEEFLAFIADAPLVIHNAEFDLRFLDAELKRIGRPGLDRARAIDTVHIARRKFPGAQASLDALCRRFGVDNSGRTLHGALLDCQLLAEVYLELVGGRQPELAVATINVTTVTVVEAPRLAARQPRPPRPHAPSEAELAAHAAMLAGIKDAIWNA
jgi:DNA polymerase-3 subunit epsilon